MSCWERIGISPTVDKMLIKRAYAKQLRLHHPEDDPEGFKTLRAALEDALAQAKCLSVGEVFISSQEIDLTPTVEKSMEQDEPQQEPITVNELDFDESKRIFEQLQRKIIELYGHFDSRVQLSLWKLALDGGEQWNIEVKQNTAFWLFNFIGHYPFIPENIFNYLEKRFSWYDNYLALKREFSEEFIDSVFDRFSRAKWSLSYQGVDFSDPSLINDVESYLSKREHLEYLVLNKQGNGDELITELNKFCVQDFELDRLLFLYYQNLQSPSQASAYCKKLVVEHPNRVEGYLNKGNIDYRQKRFSEAAHSYKAVLALDESHGIALKGLAGCYLELNDLFSAKCLYEQALLQVPFDVEARIQLIQINQKLIKHSFDLLVEQPNSAKAHKQIAEGYLEIGAYTECIEFLEGIIDKTKPIFENTSRLVKGSIFSVLFRWLFVSDIEQVFNYRNSELHHMLGLAYEATKQAEKAEVAYMTALMKAEDEGTNGYDSLVQLADFYIEHKEYEEALSLLKKACMLTPDSARVFALLADAQRYLEMQEEALNSINRAIALDDRPWIYYSIRSILLISAQSYKAAAGDLNKVLQAAPNFSGALYRQGVCHRHLGLYKEAMAFFKSAVDYNTGFRTSALEWLKLACEVSDLDNAELAMSAFLNADGALETVADYKLEIEKMSNQRSDTHE
ncbi:J domain-containing protein [Shewanella woodyi]|uniref:TPR repeat-containing protein n=1 Tax=Shewanella woodyi (strain ATCC 51908 / MS32) TaxID=392500 RepID=B1KGR2_SHEWM|nr:J domain-containing protein [Shewanella woodyi]ACA86781.1 TPR repeat-containing protein [Shewanella woodyi ATCC 51908]